MKRILLLALPLLIAILAFSPNKFHTISGTIIDESGASIPGVSVTIKGNPRTGVVADNNGNFRMNVTDLNVVLIFSGAGLETKEVSLGGKTIVNVTLKRIVTTGTEVVVTALGIRRQPKELGYSTRKMKAAELSYSRGIHVQDALVGSVPGVNVRSGNKDEEGFDREGYDKITENIFHKVKDNPLSTFSIDVDAASYSNVRRFLNAGQLPPAGAVRIEEMVNYFSYSYPQPTGKDPFSITTEISDAPWNKKHKLVMIGLQGRKISTDNLPPSNLVFLIDVSGSMMSEDRLGLVKASMKLLVDQLRAQDNVSMVVYAGAAGLVLPPTGGTEKTKIKDAIDKLEAGGSTAGGAGIRLAYKTARENFVKDGNNRVILCTDGDFNVGESSDDAMERLIEEERKSGVFLTVLGYGTGNYQDSKMQKLADKGNGNHAYIDGIAEAKKVLVNEFGGTLFTIAKDVKLQLEFNPAKVQGYRLIGYENRMLAKEDFNNDKKDAGELGSGHTVTALYEVIPVGIESSFLQKVDSLKYQSNEAPLSPTSHSDEILTVKFRYKAPDGDVSTLMVHNVKDEQVSLTSTTDNFRFAASVAQFGMLLRNSEFKSDASYDNVLSLAEKAKGADVEGYRKEFLKLVKSAQLIVWKRTPEEEVDAEVGSK